MDDYFPKNPEGVIEEALNDRREREVEWDRINLFLQGEQWLMPWSRGGGWRPLKSQADSNLRVTVNKMLPIFRAALARMILIFPSANVLPTTDSQEDILKAKTSAQILQWYWQFGKLPHVGFDMARYCINYGSCALVSYYKPGEDEDPDDIQGDGDICTEAVSPYNFFFEPDADDLKESEYIAIRSYVTKRELKEDFPKHKKLIGKLHTKEKERRGKVRNKQSHIPRLEKIEWYFKDGSYGVSVGKHWLYKAEKYFSKKHFPIQIVYYNKIDGRPYGLGMMEGLCKLQWLYNKTRTRTARNLDKVGHATLMAPVGCRVNAGQWDDRHGKVITYHETGGKPWVYAPSVNISQEVDQALRVDAEMSDHAGIHSVSRGKQVPGMRSGRAIEALSDSDNADMISTVALVEAAFEKLFEVVLYLIKKYFKKDRMIRMFDHYGGAIFRTLKNTDIVDTPDIKIEPGSMFKDGTEKRRQEILELFQLKLITGQEAVEAMGSNIGIGSRLMDKIQGLRNAMDALEHIKNGRPVRMFVHEDLDSFRKVLVEFMRTEEFAELHPDIQEYIGTTIARIDTHGMGPEALAQAQALQQVLPGAPPGQQPTGPGMAVQAGPGLATSPADVEAAEQTEVRKMNASPLNRGL